jgi:hypothetical protein
MRDVYARPREWLRSLFRVARLEQAFTFVGWEGDTQTSRLPHKPILFFYSTLKKAVCRYVCSAISRRCIQIIQH